MKRLFGEFKMTWLWLVLFAVVTGLYTGLVMLVPELKGTSFRDIAESYELWLIFIVIIAVNCESCMEAAGKSLAFMLISQLLVYLVQILYGSLSLTLAFNLYTMVQLPLTFVAIPVGFVAYFCKERNYAGSVILGVYCAVPAVFTFIYAARALETFTFPRHLLTSLICIASVFAMALCIPGEKKFRICALLTAAVLTAAAAVVFAVIGIPQLY